MKIPLLGQTGESIDQAVLYQKTQNWYPHIEPGAKGDVVLYPTPGLVSFAITTDGPIRGMIEYNSLLYVVSANTLWEITSSGTTTSRGTLTTTTGRVSMAENGPANGKQLIIVDGTNGYIFDSVNTTFYRADNITSSTTDGTTANHLIDSGADFVTAGVQVGQRVFNDTDSTTALVTAVTATDLTLDADIFVSGENYTIGDADFPNGATHIEFIDGYFIANDPAVTGRWRMSNQYDGTSWGTLEYATAERSPDSLQALIVSNRLIWLLGAKTSEVWYNADAGSAVVEFPFEVIQSGFSEWGCAAPYSVSEMAGSVFYLSSNSEGDSQVIMTKGTQPTVISSLAITAAISKMSTTSDAYSYVYQKYGHNFYVLTFPTEQQTFVYDITTNMWHEWASLATGYHRSTHHVFVFGKHLVGDAISGRIFELDWDVYTDFGDTITRIRRCQPVHADDKKVKHSALWVDLKEGVGDNTTLDPKIVLRFKDNDGGWSNEKWRSMGKKGETNVRCIWRRLGRSYDRVYEIKVTDPVNAVLIAGYLRARVSGEEVG